MAKKTNIEDLVGKKINYLLIVKEGEPHITSGGHKHRTIICICDCGIENSFQMSNVLNGSTRSCGCFASKTISERMKVIKKTHGMTETPEYNIWRSMKKRCLTKTHKSYKDYGERGISICSEWVNSFDNFLNDMGLRPNNKLSLDRIDNNKGYSKENCRWATRTQQSRNVRNNVLVEYNNEIKCIAEWSEITGLSWQCLDYRINIAKWDIEKSLTTKKNGKN